MHEISETMLGKIERMLAANRAEHEGRIRRFNLAPDCQCSFCGDSGTDLATKALCACEAGDRQHLARKRSADWKLAIPERFQDYTLDACPNVDLIAQVSAWMGRDPFATGCNLVIQGSVGVGKTGAAIGVLRELHLAGKSVGYWSLPNLMDIFRQEERGQKFDRDFLGSRPVPMMDRIIGLDCLLLDDLGQERPTEYVAERLYVLVDGRYAARKPTIITTNLSGQRLADHIGKRSASRIRENYASVAAKGPDYRDRKPGAMQLADGAMAEGVADV